MLRREFLAAVAAGSCACAGQVEPEPSDSPNYAAMLQKYTSFKLETDLSLLSESERRMLPLLADAARAMDDLFWHQAYGDKQVLLSTIDDPEARRYTEINYGPWDRLDDNRPFLPGVGPKPPGAQFYPADMTKQEFEDACAQAADGGGALRSLYTIVEREGGGLVAKPYSQVFRDKLEVAAAKIREAAELADDPGLGQYLKLRAEALLTDDYQPSDMAWMDMKSNTIDFVVGPIETYEDKLFGYKAAFEAYILVKDKEWSKRLEKYVAMLPELQRGLPVPDEYKQENPGADSDLNAYDAVYYAGDCNAGSKTIAINLPNDEEVQLAKGARRLQLKNSMRAKFEQILLPISDLLIADDQHKLVNFDSFFAETMFHEVAHGLGVKNTLDGKGTVREAMKEKAASLEEGKADILGLYMITRLNEQGELEGDLAGDYVTFLAGIFRSIRFGASSAHGVANLIRFNFFEELGAFSRDESAGAYRADFEAMRKAVDALSEKILRLQGDGDYAGAVEFVERYGRLGPTLQADLDRLAEAGIPVDVVFEQGL